MKITSEELSTLTERAVGAGQMQLASVLSSLCVILQQDDPRVMHELAHHCAEHAVASRSTLGLVGIESGPQSFRSFTPPVKIRGMQHSVHTDQTGIREEPLKRATLNQRVAIYQEDSGKFYNGEVVKLPDSDADDHDYHVKLGPECHHAVICIPEVYVPR